MEPLFPPRLQSISVSDLNRYLHQLLESDELLQDIWVFGEISNFTRASSGHLYFTLKDNSASIRCVIWKSTAYRLRLELKNGLAVEVHGNVSLYEGAGQLEVTVDQVRPAGEGALYQEFIRLKNKLEAEGLFDSERKRPIPAFPERIGMVTSPSGAALQDMLNTIRRRYPLAEIVLSPTLVQGEEAPLQIVTAIRRVNRLAKPDVILLARGGGSLEDLWAFNDERVARAIVASEAPIISGVGHETDFTIADFVADLRAPTPTAAAELATPDQLDLRTDLEEAGESLVEVLEKKLQEYRWQVDQRTEHLKHLSPFNTIKNNRQQVDGLAHRSQMAIHHLFGLQRAHLSGIQTHLQTLSPIAVLERGYAIVTSQDVGETIHSLQQVQKNEALWIQVRDGKFGAKVADDGLKEQKESHA